MSRILVVWKRFAALPTQVRNLADDTHTGIVSLENSAAALRGEVATLRIAVRDLRNEMIRFDENARARFDHVLAKIQPAPRNGSVAEQRMHDEASGK